MLETTEVQKSIQQRVFCLIGRKSRVFCIGIMFILNAQFLIAADAQDWTKSFFKPQMSAFMGLALGAQPQYPAVSLEISGSFTLFRVGAELQFGLIPPFLAAWGNIGIFGGLHTGAIDLDFEHFWSQSSIGPYRNQFGDAIVLSFNGQDKLFNLYSFAPYKAKFSYIWNYWDSTMTTLGHDEQVLDLKQPCSVAFGHSETGDGSSVVGN